MFYNAILWSIWVESFSSNTICCFVAVRLCLKSYALLLLEDQRLQRVLMRHGSAEPGHSTHSLTVMSDRRTHQIPSNANPQPHWSGSSGQYASGTAGQNAPSYYPVATQSYAMGNQPEYQVADRQTHYSQAPRTDPRTSSMHAAQQSAHHSSDDRQSIPVGQATGRIRSHSHSRSHSLSHTYATSPSPPHHSSAMPNTSAAHYPPQIAFSQQVNTSQYPASPQRPFSCDMCALSFNRQHDLKRHRDTHTGEKPFVCNGGCGKTFTRKDALKRHQLVKRCGIDDDA
ncbi:hypothetical protein BKA93DRAFT_11145 [Sparassis latifolia]